MVDTTDNQVQLNIPFINQIYLTTAKVRNVQDINKYSLCSLINTENMWKLDKMSATYSAGRTVSAHFIPKLDHIQQLNCSDYPLHYGGLVCVLSHWYRGRAPQVRQW